MKNQKDEVITGNTQHLKILYQDEWILVVYKPSGLLSVSVNQNHKIKSAESVLETILRKKGTYSSSRKPLPVHRLDRDTSGVMIFALNKNAQKKIMDNWQELVTSRCYRALAENPKKINIPAEGTIDKPLAFNAYNVAYVPKKEDIVAKKLKTVSAVTHYKVLNFGKKYTFFELELETGRKNQIRAHLASMGFPLAGDSNYRAKTNPFNRLCLHARTIEFVHPFTNEKLKFEVPEPSQWTSCCEKK